MTISETQKRNARAYANVYQRRGLLKKLPCEKCGSENSQKHHEDYSKPLMVRWLCRRCHIAEHGGSIRIAAHGAGNCAKCDKPKLSGFAYCREHKNAYQREWAKARSNELLELRKFVSESRELLKPL